MQEKAGDPEKVDLEEVMGEYDVNIQKAIAKLKKTGYKVALLTNNGFWSPAKERSLLLKDVSDFDVVVESCREGHRKPDPEIYHVIHWTNLFIENCLDNNQKIGSGSNGVYLCWWCSW